jgi:two-component system response regulator HydG
MIGNSDAMKGVYESIRRFAGLDASVLIIGESGTGKGLAARALHNGGLRAGAPFLRVHCAVLSLAAEGQTGASPLALAPPVGGTLFLDEVGDLTPDAQLRLMALLERPDMTAENGDPAVRIVSATQSNLGGLVKRGKFREDLHYRLHGAALFMPPLRERREDIPALARHFLQRAADRSGGGVKRLSADVEAVLLTCHWPGNVRQLKNIMDEAAAVCKGGVVSPADLPAGFPKAGAPDGPPRAEKTAGDVVTRKRILEALEATKWHKSNAAVLLGIGRTTFYRKMGEFGL